MIDLTLVAGGHGGVLTLAQLEERGIGSGRRGILLQSGELTRVRNGWFAIPGADEQVVRAVRLGGRLSGATLLDKLGLWVMPDNRLHVAMRPNASRLRSPDDRHKPWSGSAAGSVCVKWQTHPWDPSAPVSTDSVMSAIAHLVLCSDRESAIVTIDSALNTTLDSGGTLLTLTQLHEVLGTLPAKYGRIAEMVDRKAQSGLESLARLRMRARGIRVSTQVYIAGVGYVDVLVGDRLVVELDSRAHHLGDNYERDRARDLELFRQGFLVIRVSYRSVLYDWEKIEETILAAVRRDDHLRHAVHDRLGLARSS